LDRFQVLPLEKPTERICHSDASAEQRKEIVQRFVTADPLGGLQIAGVVEAIKLRSEYDPNYHGRHKQTDCCDDEWQTALS